MKTHKTVDDYQTASNLLESEHANLQGPMSSRGLRAIEVASGRRWRKASRRLQSMQWQRKLEDIGTISSPPKSTP